MSGGYVPPEGVQQAVDSIARGVAHIRANGKGSSLVYADMLDAVQEPYLRALFKALNAVPDGGSLTPLMQATVNVVAWMMVMCVNAVEGGDAARLYATNMMLLALGEAMPKVLEAPAEEIDTVQRQ